MNKRPILYIVIPCYNEEAVLPVTASKFLSKLNDLINKNFIHNNSRILFINDGSKDKTWEIISDLNKKDIHYTGICLSRNRGHQNALLAGLMECKDKCDICISIDCDGQDDINIMDEMINQYKDGNEIVYGARSKRETDTLFKKATAEAFYKILNVLGVDIIYNHADYRLVSSKVLKEFANFKEVNLFLRGMFPLLGFKNTIVYYERLEREAGMTHYPIGKMVAFAIEGITSLSIQPLRIITITGFLISILSFIGILWACLMYVLKNVISGWSSIICSLFFIGGLQILFIGILGEYLGKIYLESKRRPRYIISEKIGL